jgi:hypothetical protein
MANHSIAQQTGLSRPAVLGARAAFANQGTAGICAPQKRKRSRRILTSEREQRIQSITLTTKPAGSTHWSASVRAAKLGVSLMIVQRVRRRCDVQPHRVEKYKISNDLKFEDKVRDVAGLCLDPPDRISSEFKETQAALFKVPVFWLSRYIRYQGGQFEAGAAPRTSLLRIGDVIMQRGLRSLYSDVRSSSLCPDLHSR